VGELSVMNILIYISNIMIPLVVFYIVGMGLLKKKNIYDDFIVGAKEGIKTVYHVMPTLIGLMIGVGVLKTSGLLLFITEVIAGYTEKFGVPAAIIPPTIIRMFSSSAATGLVLDLFKEYGTDSRIGLIASIMMSCTETIFYTMSIYFMAAKVKKTRYTLTGALLATFAGILASVWLAGYV
jgi:spore maturation protein B